MTISQIKVEAYTHGFDGGFMERGNDLPKSYQKGRKDERKSLLDKIKGIQDKEEEVMCSVPHSPEDDAERLRRLQLLDDILKQLK